MSAAEYPLSTTDFSWVLKVEEEVEQLMSIVPTLSENLEDVSGQLDDLAWTQISEGLGVF